MRKRNKKTKKGWVKQFCEAFEKRFPNISFEVVERDSRAFEVVAYADKESIMDLAEAMGKVTLDILEKGGPYIYLVVDYPRQKAA